MGKARSDRTHTGTIANREGRCIVYATCDRCCAKALTSWWNDSIDDIDAELVFCGNHSDRNAEALVVRGWALIHDVRVDDLHPALPALSTDPATH